MTKTEFLIRYVNLDYFRDIKCYEFTSISYSVFKLNFI